MATLPKIAPAKAPQQRTAKDIQAEMQRLMTELETARQTELGPKKEEINTKFAELLELVNEVITADENYKPPFVIRIDRSELNDENILSFVGDDGKTKSEINVKFSGGNKKVSAHLADMVRRNLIKEFKKPATGGKGKEATAYSKKK